MIRKPFEPRNDWREKCEEAGFSFHSMDGTYWDESVCYEFTSGEVDCLEAATEELHRLCLAACDQIVTRRRFAELAIPKEFAELLTDSWRNREASIYGRFDLSWDGEGPPKLLEYNADTPTALLESSVVQWHWLEDAKRSGRLDPGADQFNSLHEKLIERWAAAATELPDGTPVYFSCVKQNDEDLGNVEYLRDTAIQAGLRTAFIHVEDIGWNESRRQFIDIEDESIEVLFKLYPWEWLVRESFGANLLHRSTRFIEPPWKMMLSNKALLAILWEMFPDHENLLPSYLDPAPLHGAYVRKPIYSREGANISLRRDAGALATAGTYGAEGWVYQAYAPLARFDDVYAVIGAWIVGERAAGIGVREDDTPITKNTSRFVPHFFI